MSLCTKQAESGKALSAIGIEKSQRVRHGGHAHQQCERCEPNNQSANQSETAGQAFLAMHCTGWAVNDDGARRKPRCDSGFNNARIGVTRQANGYPIVVIWKVKQDSSLLG